MSMTMNKVSILVKVLGIQCWYAYPSCSVCHKKVRKLQDQNEKLWCSTCLKSYTQKNIHYRYHVNITVSDHNGIAKVTVFGKCLDVFFGLTATEFCRYVTKCESQKCIQELDMNKMVHLAMEKCFVGEMVYLAFLLTNPLQNNSQMQTNVLPAIKAKNVHGSSQMAEILANGIYRVENERKELSIANVFAEYLSNFEKSVKSDNWKITDNIASDNYFSEESKVSFHEKDCDASKAVSPRNLLGVSSYGNNFPSSISTDCEPKESDDIFRGLSLGLENAQRSPSSKHGEVEGDTMTLSEKAVINIIRNENFLLSDLQQSFCWTSNTSNPRMCTSIKDKKFKCDPRNAMFCKGLSENKNVEPLCLSTTDLFSKSDIPGYSATTNAATRDNESEQDKEIGLSEILTHLSDGNVNNEFDMLFDSPTSEDLDAFFAEISLTELCQKDEHSPGHSGEPTSTSFFNIFHCEKAAKTCLTSTPSLNDHSFYKINGLDGDVSPIYCDSKSTPKINHDDVKKKNIVYDHVMFPSAMKLSQCELQTTSISQLETCSYISRKRTCHKEKHKSKSILRCILNRHKSSKRSSNSSLNNVVHVSQGNLSGSPISSCTPLVQDTTPLRKCTEISMSPTESERDFNGSNKEIIESRGEFQNLPLYGLTSRGELDIEVCHSSHNNSAFLTTNVCNEKPSSTFGSPLLFSP